jgi:capsular polysaccharide biosynthesis protein
MQNVENNDVVEIDLMEIFGLMLHRLWLIILCAVAAGAVGYMVSRFVLTEQFESATRIYVLNRQNDDMLTYSDVQLGTQLTKDFTQIIKSRYVLEQVIDICGIEDTSAELASRVNVDTQSDTRIVTITVTDTDPAMAQFIANELREAAAERIMYVMDIQAVNVVDEANLPTSPSAPNVIKWTAIGFLVGAFLCMAVVLIQFLLDDTIKTSDDIEKYLGLSTLGMIPIREEKDGKDHEKGSHNSGNRVRSGDRQQDREEVGYSQDDSKNFARKRKSVEAIADADMHDGTRGYSENGEEDSYAED